MRAGSQKPSSTSSSRLSPSSPPLPTSSVSGASALCEEWQRLLPRGLRGVPKAIAQPPGRRQAQPGPLLKCTAAAPHFARIPCRLKNQVQGHWHSTRGPSFSSPPWLLSSSLAAYHVPKWARPWSHVACLRLLEHASALSHLHADANAASSALQDQQTVTCPQGQLQALRPFPILCSLPSSSSCNCHDPGILKYSELYLRT